MAMRKKACLARIMLSFEFFSRPTVYGIDRVRAEWPLTPQIVKPPFGQAESAGAFKKSSARLM
jgi:hypothetical protein